MIRKVQGGYKKIKILGFEVLNPLGSMICFVALWHGIIIIMSLSIIPSNFWCYHPISLIIMLYFIIYHQGVKLVVIR
jgi:uncharacterized membrane protein